jgi:Undecaprenyl-phosphate glucose phosphotransferase
MNKPLLNVLPHQTLNNQTTSVYPQRKYSRNVVLLATMAIDIYVVSLTIALTWLGYIYFYLGLKTDVFGFVNLSLLMGGIIAGLGLLRKDYAFHYFLKTKGHGQRLFACWNIGFIILLAVSFLFKSSEELSRGHILLAYTLGFPFLWAMRLSWVNRLRGWSKIGRIQQERVIIIGKKNDIMRFIGQFQPWNHGLLLCESFILEGYKQHESQENYLSRQKYELRKIAAQARGMGLSDIFIALPWQDRALIEIVVDELASLPVSVHLTPEGIMEKFSDLSVTQLGDVAALALSRPPLSTSEITFKRVADIAIASLSLIVVVPLLGLVALLVWFDSKGAIFYKQERMGFNQNKFNIYKFRTMFVMEEGSNMRQATRDDPRITRLGRFLRKWNIDELPQIFNVIKGDMSLVGPRPHSLMHDIEFSERLSTYARRYHFRPGMTGWSQVNGLRGAFTSKNTIDKRVESDLWYMNNWSIGLDLFIMLRTVTSKKAYENAF